MPEDPPRFSHPDAVAGPGLAEPLKPRPRLQAFMCGEVLPGTLHEPALHG